MTLVGAHVGQIEGQVEAHPHVERPSKPQQRATAHQKPGWYSNTSSPMVAQAAAIWPADKVTWRTSSPRPKKVGNHGHQAQHEPQGNVIANPEMFSRRKAPTPRAQRPAGG